MYIIADIVPDVVPYIMPHIICRLFGQSVRLGCLNNGCYVQVVALLPILKGSACTEMDEGWFRHRRLELYFRSMDRDL